MKTTILTIILVLGVIVLANAQSTGKGTFSLGGDVAYSHLKTANAESHSQNYDIVLMAGYFVENNVQLGLGLGYTTQVSRDATNAKSRSEGMAVAPFALYRQGNR